MITFKMLFWKYKEETVKIKHINHVNCFQSLISTSIIK